MQRRERNEQPQQQPQQLDLTIPDLHHPVLQLPMWM
jgi:hypothetical protein